MVPSIRASCPRFGRGVARASYDGAVSQETPQVLFSSAAFFARALSDTFRLVADAGYEGVEVMVTKDPASQDPRQMRALASEFGLTIGALHAPSLLLTRKVWGTDPIGKIDRAIEVAQDAEIPVVVTHPPFRWQRAYRRWIEDHLPDLAQDTGVTLAIENMFPLRMGERGVTFHANQDLDDLEGLPDLVLDTSHAAVAGHDLLDVRRRFGDRLRHVHLSDNAGKGWDSHLPPGEGILDLDGFLAELAADGYRGSVSLEVDLRRHLTHADRLHKVMIDMRERAELRLAVSA
jgi:sugar phosphate isomerase/epimerase